MKIKWKHMMGLELGIFIGIFLSIAILPEKYGTPLAFGGLFLFLGSAIFFFLTRSQQDVIFELMKEEEGTTRTYKHAKDLIEERKEIPTPGSRFFNQYPAMSYVNEGKLVTVFYCQRDEGKMGEIETHIFIENNDAVGTKLLNHISNTSCDDAKQIKGRVPQFVNQQGSYIHIYEHGLLYVRPGKYGELEQFQKKVDELLQFVKLF